MTEKVLITGMGVVSPLGEGVKENWEALAEPSLRGAERRALPYSLSRRPVLRGYAGVVRSHLSSEEQIASLTSFARNDNLKGFQQARGLSTKAITEALSLITADNANAWFRHSIPTLQEL